MSCSIFYVFPKSQFLTLYTSLEKRYLNISLFVKDQKPKCILANPSGLFKLLIVKKIDIQCNLLCIAFCAVCL